MEGDDSVVTTTTRIVRPFKIIAVILIVLAFIAMIVVLVNSTWIRATGFHQGLWTECFNGTRIIPTLETGLPATQTPSEMACYGAVSSAWLSACQALVILALILTLASFVLALFALLRGKRYSNFYKIAGALLFLAALLMLITLAVFPAMSIQSDIARFRTNWELAWGYGLGWGAFLLQVAAAVLLVFAPDKQEIFYSEKTY